MLAKIEDAYLGVLRLAILIVTGLALLAAAGALVLGTVKGAQSISSSSADAQGRGLAESVLEKRLATEVGSPAAGAVPRVQQPIPYSEAVGTAAETFARYLHRQAPNPAAESELIARLNERWSSTPSGYQPAYDASLRSLTREISASTGRPLSRDRVVELIAWHHSSFLASAEQLDAARQEASAQSWAWIARAGQAFLLFVIIAFYFLLVRVERHLRLVRVALPSPPPNPAGDRP